MICGTIGGLCCLSETCQRASNLSLGNQHLAKLIFWFQNAVEAIISHSPNDRSLKELRIYARRLEEDDRKEFRTVNASPTILQIASLKCKRILSAKVNHESKTKTERLKRVSIPHNDHVLTVLVDWNL